MHSRIIQRFDLSIENYLKATLFTNYNLVNSALQTASNRLLINFQIKPHFPDSQETITKSLSFTFPIDFLPRQIRSIRFGKTQVPRLPLDVTRSPALRILFVFYWVRERETLSILHPPPTHVVFAIALVVQTTKLHLHVWKGTLPANDCDTREGQRRSKGGTARSIPSHPSAQLWKSFH